MAGLNWANFTAFNGLLDRTIMQQEMNPPVGNDPATVNWDAELAKFTNFINTLRGNPTAYGIPNARLDDVNALLQEFFPAGAAPNRYRLDRIGHSPQYSANPVDVTYGTAAQPFRIADAPTALGYLFTIVSPPQGVALTWQEYYLPLLAYFTKCIWLAFQVPAQGSIPNSYGVPIMGCVMYLGVVNPGPHYIYGSTYAPSKNALLAETASQTLEFRRALDIFRKGTILHNGLAFVNPAGSPAPVLPQWEPKTAPMYAKNVLAIFRGRLNPPGAQTAIVSDKDANTTLTAAVVTIRAYYTGLNEVAKAAAQSIDIRTDERTRPELDRLLLELLQIRLRAPYNPQGADITNAFKELIKYYLTPQLFIPGIPPLADTKVDLPPGYDQTIAAEADVIWLDKSVVALQKLEWAWHELTSPIQTDTWLPSSPWGRCAETYPIVALQRNYFPNTNMQAVRGMSLECRKVGLGSYVFNQGGFNSQLLDDVGSDPDFNNKGAYRYPCENCKALLPIYNLDPVGYDSDIDIVPHVHGPW